MRYFLMRHFNYDNCIKTIFFELHTCAPKDNCNISDYWLNLIEIILNLYHLNSNEYKAVYLN